MGSRRRQTVGGSARAIAVALAWAGVMTALLPGTVGFATPPAAADGNEAPAAPLAARSITAGAPHSCALLPSGRVKCWGGNGEAELGQGDTDRRGDEPGDMFTLEPVDLGGGRTATAIAAGASHTCALLDDASVKCWGRNGHGQLGVDSTDTIGDEPGEIGVTQPVDLGGGRTATAITAGGSHTCALLDDATVKCWGDNWAGQLGQDHTDTIGDGPGEMAGLQPVDLGGHTATAISAGGNHTCAVLDDATVKCWGQNGEGRLGQDHTDDLGNDPGEMAALDSVDLGNGRTATAVSAGLGHTCALLDDATVKCWGYNWAGQLGQGSTDSRGDESGEMGALDPVNLGDGRTATMVTAGDSHTCAVLDDGTVKCWGNAGSGQLGYDNMDNLGVQPDDIAATGPVDLGSGRTATAVTAGDNHTCALLDNGAAKCWGQGDSGQLGQGSAVNLGDHEGEVATLPPIDLGVPFRVRLTADETAVTAGDEIHYHVTITNNTAGTVTGVAVTDTDAPACAGPAPDIASGESHTVDCAHATTDADAPAHQHVARVDSNETAAVDSNQVEVEVTIPTGFIAGTVTRSGTGDPIGGAFVAGLSPATFAPTGVAVTEGDGTYQMLTRVGDHLVYLVDPSGNHVAGFLGAPDPVTVTKDNTTTADASLNPSRGSISGRVEESGGADLEGVLAVSVDGNTGRPGPGAVTNSIGAYQIDNIAAGNNYLVFVDLTGAHTPEFHDDAPHIGAASPVAVIGGQTATDTDADLTPQDPPAGGALLEGHVTQSGTGDPLGSVAVIALHAATYQIAAGDVTDGSGFYDIALDPDDYVVQFYDLTGTHRLEWHDDLPFDLVASADPVTVAAGPASTVDAVLDPATGAASGTVTQSGSGDPLAGIAVAAIDATGRVTGVTTTPGDGTWTLTGLPAGVHRIRYIDTGLTHAAQYHQGTDDFATATPITIVGGQTQSGLDATLDPT